MKKQHSLSILCAAALLFAACEKTPKHCADIDYPVIVEGYVFTGTGGDSIPNAKVIVYEDRQAQNYTNIGYYETALDSTISDEKGYYRLEFKGRATAIYLCAAFKEGYYNFQSGSQFRTGYDTDCDKNKAKSPVTIKQYICPLMKPIAYMQFHIKNIAPANAGDKISFYPIDYRAIEYANFPEIQFSMNGANADTVVTYHILSQLTSFSYYYDLYLNGVLTQQKVIPGVTCSPGDTCKFDVFY